MKKPVNTDLELIDWLDREWNSLKKKLKTKDLPESTAKEILISLANCLRIYISSVRTTKGGKKSGILMEFKPAASEKIIWLQKQMITRPFDACSRTVLLAIQYARAHTGNLQVEGSALRKPVSSKDRKRLESLTRRAAERYALSSGEEQLESDDRLDDLRALGVEHGDPELDEGSNNGNVHPLRNGDSQSGI